MCCAAVDDTYGCNSRDTICVAYAIDAFRFRGVCLVPSNSLNPTKWIKSNVLIEIFYGTAARCRQHTQRAKEREAQIREVGTKCFHVRFMTCHVWQSLLEHYLNESLRNGKRNHGSSQVSRELPFMHAPRRIVELFVCIVLAFCRWTSELKPLLNVSLNKKTHKQWECIQCVRCATLLQSPLPNAKSCKCYDRPQAMNSSHRNNYFPFRMRKQ